MVKINLHEIFHAQCMYNKKGTSYCELRKKSFSVGGHKYFSKAV